MTEFQNNIILLIIDKGLIVLLLVILGYYFNQKLEKHKTLYNHKIITEKFKIESLLNFSVAIFKLNGSITRIFDKIATIKFKQKNKENYSYLIENLKKEWKDTKLCKKEFDMSFYKATPFLFNKNLGINDEIANYMTEYNTLKQMVKIIIKQENTDNFNITH